mgnify:CR=1 FL=1
MTKNQHIIEVENLVKRFGPITAVDDILGRALIGKGRDDDIEVQTPKGKRAYMVKKLTTIHELLAQENGKPITQTRAEVAVTASIFRGFAEESKRIFGRVMPVDAVRGNERHFAITIRQPLGVVAAIVPFNYPVELWGHKAASALAGGAGLG